MTKKNILIIGAGFAGKELLKEIKQHPELDLIPVGFIDDDASKTDKKIRGLPIFGDRHILKSVIKNNEIHKVFLALPSVDGEIFSTVLKICIEMGIPCQTIPRVREIIEGKVDIKRIRDVQIEDLLERPIRKPDVKDVAKRIENTVVMVTGAAGSIGSELCRQIASYKPKKIIMYDWWENGLYDLGIEFKEFFPDIQIVLNVGNIQDQSRLTQTLKKYQPSFIFHAAAFKHVPLMEDNVIEAVKNNIFGTYNLITAALDAKVKQFVFVSTDKAVHPKSIMGITKLIGELLASTISTLNTTQVICVRFGNVLNSAGSVLPLFRKQLLTGTITVTDKKMTRFFMTIHEAVQLILKATVLGKENEIFVLDMGKPRKIIDIAKKFILLSGLIPEKDIAIKYIGPRPGEKLKEELSTNAENVSKTKFEKLFVLKKHPVDQQQLLNLLTQLKETCEKYDEDNTKKILKKFVAKLD